MSHADQKEKSLILVPVPVAAEVVEWLVQRGSFQQINSVGVVMLPGLSLPCALQEIVLQYVLY